MNHTPHLRAEDRPHFERLLDEALRDATVQAALQGLGARLTTEQLRAKALFDQDAIAAAADDEYHRFVELRDGLQQPVTNPVPDPGGPPGPGTFGELVGQLRSDDGGVWPLLTVLVPMLTVGAAVPLLLLGYAIDAVDGTLSYGHAVVLAGWTAVGAAALSLAVGLVGLVLTALRDGRAGPEGGDPRRRSATATARAAWLTALRQEITPYLLTALDADPVPAPRPPEQRPAQAP